MIEILTRSHLWFLFTTVMQTNRWMAPPVFLHLLHPCFVLNCITALTPHRENEEMPKMSQEPSAERTKTALWRKCETLADTLSSSASLQLKVVERCSQLQLARYSGMTGILPSPTQTIVLLCRVYV